MLYKKPSILHNANLVVQRAKFEKVNIYLNIYLENIYLNIYLEKKI